MTLPLLHVTDTLAPMGTLHRLPKLPDPSSATVADDHQDAILTQLKSINVYHYGRVNERIDLPLCVSSSQHNAFPEGNQRNH